MRSLTSTKRVLGLVLGGLLALAPVGGRVLASAHDDAQRARFDAALSAYLGGDAGIIERTFPKSGDYAARAQDLDKWLEEWDPGKAVFVLDAARRAAQIGPRFTAPILLTGRSYLRKAAGGRTPASGRDADLVAMVGEIAEREAPGSIVKARISGEAFLTPPGQLYDLVVESIREETGVEPELSTSKSTLGAGF